MKKCPKCKSSEVKKTHSEKYVCKMCGFSQVSLEVVSEGDDFQQKFGYRVKIAPNVSRIQEKPQQENITAAKLTDTILKNYQTMLMKAVRSFSKAYSLSKQFEVQVRRLWFGYLRRMKEDQNRITGIFYKYITKNTQNKNKQEEQAKEVKKKRGRPKKKRLQQQQNEQQQHQHEIEQVLNRDKDSRNIRNIFTQIKRNRHKADYDELREQALQYIYKYDGQINTQKLQYIAQKYCEFVIHKKQLSQIKNNKINISNYELKKIGKLRNHVNYTKSQMMYVLLLEDLLRKWAHNHNHQHKQQFSQLLIQYRSQTININKVTMIDKILQQLVHMINKQYKEEEHSHIPQLSYSLIYAIINIIIIQLKLTVQISQIIWHCGELHMYLIDNEPFINNQVITNTKIRQISQQMHKYLNVHMPINLLNVNKWIHKYCEEYGINQKHGPYINKISNVLVPMRVQAQNKNSVLLMQDVLSKCIIMIYVKLSFSFDNNTIPIILSTYTLQHMLQDKEEVQLIRLLKEKAKGTVRILDMLQFNQGLKQYNSKKQKRRNICNYGLHNYSSLNQLSTSTLTNLFKGTTSSLKLPNRKNQKQHNMGKFEVIPYKQNRKYRLRENIKNYLLQLREEEYEFDYPAQNYEFMYDYYYNIQYAGRDKFVHIAESMVAGQCKMRQFYEQLCKLEKQLLKFQVNE